MEWYNVTTGLCDIVYMSKILSFSPDYEFCVDADKIVRDGSGYVIRIVDGMEIYDKLADTDLPDKIENSPARLPAFLHVGTGSYL